MHSLGESDRTRKGRGGAVDYVQQRAVQCRRVRRVLDVQSGEHRAIGERHVLRATTQHL